MADAHLSARDIHPCYISAIRYSGIYMSSLDTIHVSLRKKEPQRPMVILLRQDQKHEKIFDAKKRRSVVRPLGAHHGSSYPMLTENTRIFFSERVFPRQKFMDDPWYVRRDLLADRPAPHGSSRFSRIVPLFTDRPAPHGSSRSSRIVPLLTDRPVPHGSSRSDISELL
ncbi:unnamed protein product [Nesidiocoris tenuis]|uniref:Uncharacterized protein n=1 Tax=Nesidiocoris tenuis TaxID=355587 RepID=A0A6H5GCT5_9HEMI|nr:unnamed protein product [Nesidiocoris tenuis]